MNVATESSKTGEKVDTVRCILLCKFLILAQSYYTHATNIQYTMSQRGKIREMLTNIFHLCMLQGDNPLLLDVGFESAKLFSYLLQALPDAMEFVMNALRAQGDTSKKMPAVIRLIYSSTTKEAKLRMARSIISTYSKTSHNKSYTPQGSPDKEDKYIMSYMKSNPTSLSVDKIGDDWNLYLKMLIDIAIDEEIDMKDKRVIEAFSVCINRFLQLKYRSLTKDPK